MKIEELKKKTPEDLRRELDATMLDLLRFSAQGATGGKESGKVRELRRKIARIKTLLGGIGRTQ